MGYSLTVTPRLSHYQMTADFLLNFLFLFYVVGTVCSFLVYRELRKQLPPELIPRDKGLVRVNDLNRYDILGMTILVLFFASTYLLPESDQSIEETKEKMQNPLILFILMVTQLFPASMVIFILTLRGVSPTKYFNLEWPKFLHIFWIAPATVTFMFSIMLIFNQLGYEAWMSDMFGDNAREQQTVQVYRETELYLIRAMMSLMVVIFAPLTEEVIFRGYIYPIAKRYSTKFLATVMTSLFFALVHNNITAVLPLFILAILLTIAYEKTGSIWAPISIHALFNAGAVFAMEWEKIMPNGSPE